MSARIVILSGNHACNNPRAIKEAETFAEAGFEVEWLGGWVDSALAERDRNLTANRKWRFVPVIDWTRSDYGAQLLKDWQRFKRFRALKQFEWFGLESGGQLGYCIRNLLKAAQKRTADLYIAHSEPGMWVAEQLRLQGHRVGIDMEDWFAEDLLPEARKQRPLRLLRRLEKKLLRNSAYSLCTSHAMSEALADEYGCQPPIVIYNAFPWADRQSLDGLIKDRRDRNIPSIHWYSQTLGPGRGLEDLFDALPYVKFEAEIHLRGKSSTGFESWLSEKVPAEWRSRIFIHDLVSNEELLSRIAEHDIGFAGEMKYCRSRDLTVTNKILQYLLGGLSVIASDTSGQYEVAKQAGAAVSVYKCGDIVELAGRLNELLGSIQRLSTAKAYALEAAKKKFCWEIYSDLLIDSAHTALSINSER